MTAVFDDDAVAAAVARGLDSARDFPDPVNDPFCSAANYVQLGRDFRGSAWRHLEEKDLPQASNKAWGLVAETVQAISLHHGRVIHSHRGIWGVMDALARLVSNSGDEATQRWIRVSFGYARMLHSNFYQNRMEADDILAGLITCEELSELLYALFWQEGGTAAVA